MSGTWRSADRESFARSGASIACRTSLRSRSRFERAFPRSTTTGRHFSKGKVPPAPMLRRSRQANGSGFGCDCASGFSAMGPIVQSCSMPVCGLCVESCRYDLENLLPIVDDDEGPSRHTERGVRQRCRAAAVSIYGIGAIRVGYVQDRTVLGWRKRVDVDCHTARSSRDMGSQEAESSFAQAEPPEAAPRAFPKLLHHSPRPTLPSVSEVSAERIGRCVCNLHQLERHRQTSSTLPK